MSAYKEYLLGLWKARSSKFDYFASPSLQKELRTFRLARMGLIISFILIGVLGITEILFLGFLFWELIH